MWETVTHDDGDHVHVIPLADSAAHVATVGCGCGPVVEPVPRDDGTTAWLFTHNAHDGREALEAKTEGHALAPNQPF